MIFFEEILKRNKIEKTPLELEDYLDKAESYSLKEYKISLDKLMKDNNIKKKDIIKRFLKKHSPEGLIDDFVLKSKN